MDQTPPSGRDPAAQVQRGDQDDRVVGGRSLTEASLVAAIRAIVEPPAGYGAAARKIALGIGDDAAAWQPSRSHLSVVTTDALIDGVHFLSASMAPQAIGHRAFAANLSDIAAMGARPVLATVALGIPPALDERWLLDMYRGMMTLARRHATQIVGGDIVRAPVLTLSITIIGEVARQRLKRRSGGRPGDIVAVTGPLGASRAGLETVRRSVPAGDAAVALARAAYERPTPRVAEGRWLAASRNVHAMMDCSDGLSTDLERLAQASECGAVIEGVPVDPSAEAIARALGDDALRYALHGGEDFELLVAVAPRAFDHLARRFAGRFDRPLIGVGLLEQQAGLRLRSGTTITALAAGGFDHLAALPAASTL